jgi:hypothetical protein
MGRIKPKTVSNLMDIANRFADGEDACNNKWTRSPEDDRGNRYGSQKRRSRNYDNYGSHSQVAAGYKDNSYQGNDRRNSRYCSYGKEDYASSKRFQTKEPREYNPSPEDMLNRPMSWSPGQAIPLTTLVCKNREEENCLEDHTSPNYNDPCL